MNVLNGARYLKATLNSLFAQTFTDWELIFWDDLSDDDSRLILGQYEDRRVTYGASTARRGLGRARDEAIRCARGEWLAFLDQDDIWTPDKLERQNAVIESETSGRLGIVYCRTLCFDMKRRTWPFDRWYGQSRLPEGDIAGALFAKPSFIATSAAVVRRRAAEQVGGIPPDTRMIPDYALLLDVARHYRAACVHDTCCWYRCHDGNMSSRYRLEIHREVLEVIRRHADMVSPAFYERRARVHETLVALEEIYSGQVATGSHRLLASGSLAYLASRPLVVSYRAMSRWPRRLREQARQVPQHLISSCD